MIPARADRLWRAASERLFIALPLVSLALGALAWLRYSIDLPWYDDWRGYDGGWIESLDPRRLFQPINYTLSPIGLALDALAQRFLDGNSVAYQLISMVLVLGSLLTLQWLLLRQALADRWQAALCFSLTVFMLQPGSYWGLENLAYHQALPLVFLCAALLLLVRADAPSRWRGPAVFGLAVLAGLSYISGAFAGTATGLALLVVTWLAFRGEERAWRLRDAAWLAAGALGVTAVQYYFSFAASHASAGAVPLALPWQPAFWWFYLGKLARALLLPVSRPLVSVVVTAGVCAAVLALAAATLRQAARPAPAPRTRAVALVFLPLLALVGTYMMLIAAGRGALRPPGMDAPLAIFALAFTRFHFFWATLLWPWALAAALVLAGRWPARTWVQGALAAAALGLAGLLYAHGAFDHMTHQRWVGADREVKLHCLQQELQKLEPVRCPFLLPSRPGDLVPDARPAYLHALRIGASFARKIPLLPGSPSLAASPKLFDLDGSVGRVDYVNMRHVQGPRFEVLGWDPQMYLNSGQPGLAARCTTVEVLAELRVAEREFVQVYWGTPDFVGPYAEDRSDARVVEPTRFETISMRLRSPAGFHHALRFDPVAGGKPFDLRSLKVYCVRQER